jgi:uncharacterized coiled-coil protein SlyX
MTTTDLARLRRLEVDLAAARSRIRQLEEDLFNTQSELDRLKEKA